MKKQFIIITFTFVFLTCSLFSQLNNWNWVFHNNIMISFNNKDTVPMQVQGSKLELNVNYGMTAFSTFTSLSDSSHNLLLYTGGSKTNDSNIICYNPVWNKNHRIVANSYETNPDMIVYDQILTHFPGKDKLAYLIKIEHSKTSDNNFIFYDIIDLSAKNGEGLAISKNNIIYSGIDFWPRTINVIRHKNQLSYWIISYGEYFSIENNIRANQLGRIFKCYLLSGNKLIDSTQFPANLNFEIYFPVSPNGQYIAAPEFADIGIDSSQWGKMFISTSYLNLIEFNQFNGRIAINRIKLCDSCSALLYEFSSDSKKFYTIEGSTNWVNENFKKITTQIFQYSISNDAGITSKSKKAVSRIISDLIYYKNKFPPPYDPDGNQGLFDNMRLGPDNKIYIRRASNIVSTLSNVNGSYDKVEFKDTALILNNFSGNFPVFLHDYYNVNVVAVGNTPVCENERLVLNVNISDTTYPRSYHWTGPNGFASDLKSPSINNVKLSQQGWYILKATVNGAELWDSVLVTVKPLAKPDITGLNKVYEAETKVYKTPQANKSNKWSVTGGEILGYSTLDSVTIKWGSVGTGKVILEQAGSEFDCKGYNEFEVTIEEWPGNTIKGKDFVCEDDSVKYTAFSSSNITNNWDVTNGLVLNKTNEELYVNWKINGLGSVINKRSNTLTNKKDTAVMNVIINPKPDKPIITDKGNNNLQTEESYLCQWYLNGEPIPGETSYGIKAKQSGKYQVIVIDTNGCKSELSEPFDYTVGVAEYSENENLSPNPATDYIEININDRGVNPSAESIRIFDLLGVEVTTPSNLTPTLSKGEGAVRIDVSSLTPGVYFVRVGNEVRKFVKM